MKMNKVLGLGLTIVLSLGCLVGCNKTEEEKIKEDATIIEDVETYELTDKEKELNKTVLNDDMFEITFIKAYEDEYGEIGYEIMITNKTNKTISFYADNTSVGNVMCEPSHYDNTTTPNKTVYTKLAWYIDNELNKSVKSINDLKDVEMTLVIIDENYNTLREITFEIK